MKFCASVLALAALQQASAFTVNGPAKASTALNSFSYLGDTNADAAVSTGTTIKGTGGASSAMSSTRKVVDGWKTSSPITVQGGALRTWSVKDPNVESVQILMKTDGRPLNSNIELWQGPDNTPQKMAVYIEDGSVRQFSAVVFTPGHQNTVAVYNTAHLEFPLSAGVEFDSATSGAPALAEASKTLADTSIGRKVEGGAVYTTPFSPAVSSVQVLLKTDGRPLNARIELLQGPNNNKQVLEVYTEDGMERPFFMVLDTPGVGNVVRIVNTATVEFPLFASVEPFVVEPGYEDDAAMRMEDPRGVESYSGFFYLDGN